MKNFFFIAICILFSLQIQAEASKKSASIFDALFFGEKEKIEYDTLFSYFSGRVLFESKNYFQAILYFEEYIFQNPEGNFVPDALFYIGESHMNLDLPEMALAFFFELNKRFPTSKSGILALKKTADIHFRKKEYSNAKLFYYDFIFHNFDLEVKSRAFYQIELCNYYLGLYSHPTEIFQNFLKKFPHSNLCSELMFELGNYYFNIGKFSDAIQEYNLLLANNPEIDWADSVYFQIALTYELQKDFTNAIKNLENLLQNCPKTTLRKSTYQFLIKCLLAEKNFLSAIDTINSLIQATPAEERNKYYQQLIDIYEELGLHNEAVNIYQIMLHNEEED